MKIIVFITLYLVPFICLAQEDPEPITKTQLTVDLGFTGIQFGAELKTGKTQTVQFRTGLLPLVYNDINYTGTGSNNIKLAGSIALSGEYRYYYNFLTRIEKMKDTRNNGANYVSFFLMYGTNPVIGKSNLREPSPIFFAGPLWGFNRYLGDQFLFHLSVGPVYQKEIKRNYSSLTIYGDLRWSFIFR